MNPGTALFVSLVFEYFSLMSALDHHSSVHLGTYNDSVQHLPSNRQFAMERAVRIIALVRRYGYVRQSNISCHRLFLLISIYSSIQLFVIRLLLYASGLLMFLCNSVFGTCHEQASVDPDPVTSRQFEYEGGM